MTTTIPAATLSAALSQAAKIVETRNTLPILACVRIGGGEVVTTNLDIEYRQAVPELDFAPIAVDAKRLLAMAQAASGEVKLTPEASALKVQSGRSRWTLPTLPADDFPTLPATGLSKPMPVPDLTAIIRRTIWAASQEATRYYLQGVFLNNESGKARFVATGGAVLACAESDVKWPKGAPDVIVPRGFCAALPDEAGSLAWNDRLIQWTAPGVTITAKLIEGTFPDYRRIFPAPNEPIAIDTAEFLATVRGVRLASDAKERKLRITRQAGALGLRIEGTSGFQGEADIACDGSEGFENCVNADFLVSALTAIEAETVAMEQSEPQAIMSFRAVASDPGINFTALVLPMRF